METPSLQDQFEVRGDDGNVYGPETAETIRRWHAEHRLEAQSEMPNDRPGPSFEMEGTAYYSLRHRIVVAFEGKATIEMEGEDQSGSFVMKTKTTVQF